MLGRSRAVCWGGVDQCVGEEWISVLGRSRAVCWGGVDQCVGEE